jgi:hypothetical protein
MPIAGKTSVGRADLLRLLAGHDESSVAQMAFALGYERAEPAPQREEPLAPIIVGSGPPPPAPIGGSQPVPAARFFYVTAQEQRDPGAVPPAEAPDWFKEARVLDRDEQSDPHTLRLPARLPLTRWARLWPVLHRLLGQSRRSRRPDLARIVRRVARGEPLRRIPLRRQHRWSPRLSVLLDFSASAQPFREDYNALCRGLRLLCGEEGVERWVLYGEPGRHPWARRGPRERLRPWPVPEPEVPVLILSDLGMLEPSPAVIEAWRQLGYRLRAAGCRPIALCPVPTACHDPVLQRLYRLHTWDRDSRLGRSVTRPSLPSDAGALLAAERLLGLLAPALVIESALLRAVRYLLPAGDADVRAEALAWSHPDVSASTQGFCFVDRAATEKYQQSFAALPDPGLKARVVRLIETHHAGLPASVRYAELETCRRLAPHGLDPELSRESGRWTEDIALTCERLPDSPALAGWRDRHLGRQTQRMWPDNRPLAALWALSQREARERGETLKLPPHVRVEDVRYFLGEASRSQPRAGVLVQRGQALVLEGPAGAASRYVELSLMGEALVIEETRRGEPGPLRRYVPTAQLPVRLAALVQDTERVQIECPSASVLIEALTCPDWATAIGRDPHGLYADLSVQGVTQRFRWIAPGSFLMGSPDSEPERYDDERQHRVTLTRGYWLAETACTQSLWQAVTGSNPGYFKDDPRNPVEQVSWKDVRTFIEALNGLVPRLGARLPTEAEWEYACRAGTETPFSFGDNITPEQVNYVGNYPYAGGP